MLPSSRSLRSSLVAIALGSLLGACAVASPDDADGVASSSSATTAADKHLTVSLASQRARAYEGARCVREMPISTGKVYEGGNFDTTLHDDRRYYDFPILSKAKVVRMRSPFAGIAYDSDVYNAIKLTSWGIYLHEANWTRTGPGESDVAGGDCGHCGNTAYAPYGFSHGCINERHDDAVWLYDWVPAANPTKKVVHVTLDALAPETCDHVSRSASDEANAGSASNPGQVTDITRDACLAHATNCLEDLQDASGAWDGRWICWKAGNRSTSGRLCKSGMWQ